MNDKVNGRALQKFTKLTGERLHGNHHAYDDVVQELITRFEDIHQNFDSDIAKDFLENNLIPRLNSYIDEAIDSELNLNSFFRDIIKPRLNIN